MNIPRKDIALEEDESLVIDLNYLWTSLQRHFKTIVATTVAFAVIGGLYSGLAYQEKYRSEATVLFNPEEMTPVVSNVEIANRFFQGKGIEVSPFKNQQELLKSRLLAKRTLKALHKQKLLLSVKDPTQLLDDVLEASHVRGTDFIRISAVSNSPEKAQKIARVYVNSYMDLLNEISSAPILRQKKLFKNQVATAEKELAAIDQSLQTYQEQYGIVDISTESRMMVTDLQELENDAKEIESSIAEKRAEVAQIRKQLKLKSKDTYSALQAVAGGHDTLLSDLQSKLNEAEEEYQVKALTYSPTNPDMVKLAEKVAVLKNQVADQQILTVGQTIIPKSVLIKDHVRADLVNRLASREAEYLALSSKLKTVRGQVSSLESQLKNMPIHQLEYARLMLEKKNREDVLTRLREKLAEIRIKEAALQKGLMVIDQPNSPASPLFPGHFHLIGLAALLGLSLSSVAVAGYSMFKQGNFRPEYIERALQVPILSVIPWAPDAYWNRCRSRNTIEVLMTPADTSILKAYQDLAINLKVQRNCNNRNTLVVSSLCQEAGQSVILSNLAFCLAQSGERVVLVDTNLRAPRLHSLFGHSLNYEKGLTELINSLSEATYKKDSMDTSALLPAVASAMLPSGLHPQLLYLNAGVSLENTFEFLNSRGFAAMVSTLKEHYDWVLFDAPPFLTNPDAAVLLGYMDGLLLLVERNADEFKLQATVKKVHRLNSSIIGCVLREPAE